MLFYALVSLSLAVVLKEATITWIVSAIFLIGTTMLLKFDFGLPVLNNYFFPKLTDSWQLLFYGEIPLAELLVKNVVLLVYTALFSYLGIYLFIKKDLHS